MALLRIKTERIMSEIEEKILQSKIVYYNRRNEVFDEYAKYRHINLPGYTAWVDANDYVVAVLEYTFTSHGNAALEFDPYSLAFLWTKECATDYRAQ